MPNCTHCGASNEEGSQYCVRCGTPTKVSSTALSPPLPVAVAVPVGEEYYVQHSADQCKYGPLRPEDVATWVRQGRLSVQDMVQALGSSNWVPMLESKLRPHVVVGAHDNRLVASTCPNCGAGLVVQIKRSGFGLFLIILGIILTPAIIGIPVFIVGYVIRWSGKGKAFYRCARCNYSS